MNFIRFEHINLACKNLNDSKKFYQTLFPEWYVRADGVYNGRHWMHLGNHQFYLALNDENEQERVHSAYENIGINHVGFVIPDGDAMKKTLEDAGIEYYTMSAPETKHRIYVNDPDGNEIELVEYNQDYALK
ncbi:MAG: VOC family protein [Chlorogloeopsis fritschii C42_A2020_084]|jgi:catechol 2,3-dioxygenase-like lactoylglutathione lyase family enzyme|uniref:VOC family protein n=1 Tax=Chlorogloeopsis fritschii TaxID=1124 RepID=UPI0019EA78D4|nr:VOC family protein [Chlorogloeopsis fritschii]MBF2005260.1 VOC family protein [Chlorogloeopsis fritschii C42_A2020_084]